MRRSLWIVLFALLNLAATPPEPPVFDVKGTREALLKLLNSDTEQKFVVEPAAKPGSREEAFLKHYIQHIKPVHDHFSKISLQYGVNHELFDAGLFATPEEGKAHQKAALEAMAEGNKYSSDPKWEAAQLEWGRLAEGLPGELAHLARLTAKGVAFDSFPPEAQKDLDRADELNQLTRQIVNSSPLKEKSQAAQVDTGEVLRAYLDDKITFAEAKARFMANRNVSLAYGQDIVEKSRDAINERARILTRLAKMKGYKNNADFSLAAQGLAHTAEFQDKQQVLKFLWGLLDQLKDVTKKYYEIRAPLRTGKALSELTDEDVNLLGEKTALLVKDYFPKEKMVTQWQETMRLSGFTDEELGQIIVDAYPRANKNNHAYMRPLKLPSPALLQVNGETLELSAKDWSPANIYILQNFIDDGIPELETGFHEGGHGLDFANQRDPFGYPRSYGWAETHSTTMENFMTDREFLLAIAETREGQKLSPELADLYIKRRALKDLEGFVHLLSSAIYDILLWDYDYEEGKETFEERALKLADEMAAATSIMPSLTLPPTVKDEGPIRRGYGYFTTDHFRSGSVRHYGYVLANVAAAMAHEALLDRLEQSTGRRTLYKQDGIAEILKSELYREGFKQPFPIAVEEFAKKKYAPEAFAGSLIKNAQAYIAEMEAALPKVAKSCEQTVAPTPADTDNH